MNQKPLVSVIMPCFNDGAYIGEAVMSVKKQTYANLEIIIVDDCSDDLLTIEKLKEYGSLSETDDSRQIPIKLLCHKTRLGPAAARNYGVKNSNGKYILPLDADDKIESSYIEKSVAIIEKYKKVGVVYCLAKTFGKKIGPWKLPPFKVPDILFKNCVFVSALYRRSDWDKYGGYNEELNGLEDWDFWLNFVFEEKEFYRIEEELFYYRRKEISRNDLIDKEIKNKLIYQVYNNHKSLYDKYMVDVLRMAKNYIKDDSKKVFSIKIFTKK